MPYPSSNVHDVNATAIAQTGDIVARSLVAGATALEANEIQNERAVQQQQQQSRMAVSDTLGAISTALQANEQDIRYAAMAMENEAGFRQQSIITAQQSGQPGKAFSLWKEWVDIYVDDGDQPKYYEYNQKRYPVSLLGTRSQKYMPMVQSVMTLGNAPGTFFDAKGQAISYAHLRQNAGNPAYVEGAVSKLPADQQWSVINSSGAAGNVFRTNPGAVEIKARMPGMTFSQIEQAQTIAQREGIGIDTAISKIRSAGANGERTMRLMQMTGVDNFDLVSQTSAQLIDVGGLTEQQAAAEIMKQRQTTAQGVLARSSGQIVPVTLGKTTFDIPAQSADNARKYSMMDSATLERIERASGMNAQVLAQSLPFETATEFDRYMSDLNARFGQRQRQGDATVSNAQDLTNAAGVTTPKLAMNMALVKTYQPKREDMEGIVQRDGALYRVDASGNYSQTSEKDIQNRALARDQKLTLPEIEVARFAAKMIDDPTNATDRYLELVSSESLPEVKKVQKAIGDIDVGDKEQRDERVKDFVTTLNNLAPGADVAAYNDFGAMRGLSSDNPQERELAAARIIASAKQYNIGQIENQLNQGVVKKLNEAAVLWNETGTNRIVPVANRGVGLGQFPAYAQAVQATGVDMIQQLPRIERIILGNAIDQLLDPSPLGGNSSIVQMRAFSLTDGGAQALQDTKNYLMKLKDTIRAVSRAEALRDRTNQFSDPVGLRL